MKVESAQNPVRKTPIAIDLMVKFDKFPVAIPFTASMSDTHEYGRILYQNAANGAYGPVA